MTVSLYPIIVLNAIGLQWAICKCKVNWALETWHNPARIPNHNQMQGDWP